MFPIRIERRYDSGSLYDSPLGYGWSIGLDRRLYDTADGDVLARSLCGIQRRFTPSGSGLESEKTDESEMISHGTFHPTRDDHYDLVSGHRGSPPVTQAGAIPGLFPGGVP